MYTEWSYFSFCTCWYYLLLANWLSLSISYVCLFCVYSFLLSYIYCLTYILLSILCYTLWAMQWWMTLCPQICVHLTNLPMCTFWTHHFLFIKIHYIDILIGYWSLIMYIAYIFIFYLMNGVLLLSLDITCYSISLCWRGLFPEISISVSFSIIARHFSFHIYILQVAIWSADASHFSGHHDWPITPFSTCTIKFTFILKFEYESDF